MLKWILRNQVRERRLKWTLSVYGPGRRNGLFGSVKCEKLLDEGIMGLSARTLLHGDNKSDAEQILPRKTEG